MCTRIPSSRVRLYVQSSTLFPYYFTAYGPNVTQYFPVSRWHSSASSGTLVSILPIHGGVYMCTRYHGHMYHYQLVTGNFNILLPEAICGLRTCHVGLIVAARYRCVCTRYHGHMYYCWLLMGELYNYCLRLFVVYECDPLGAMVVVGYIYVMYSVERYTGFQWTWGLLHCIVPSVARAIRTDGPRVHWNPVYPEYMEYITFLVHSKQYDWSIQGAVTPTYPVICLDGTSKW